MRKETKAVPPCYFILRAPGTSPAPPHRARTAAALGCAPRGALGSPELRGRACHSKKDFQAEERPALCGARAAGRPGRGPDWVAVARHCSALWKGQTAVVGEDGRAQILTREPPPCRGTRRARWPRRGPRGSGQTARLVLPVSALELHGQSFSGSWGPELHLEKSLEGNGAGPRDRPRVPPCACFLPASLRRLVLLLVLLGLSKLRPAAGRQPATPATPAGHCPRCCPRPGSVAPRPALGS